MRLPFLRSKSDAGGADRLAAGSEDPGALQAARTQARRRLIGALVLLVAAVLGFPLLFETQPRPLPGATPAGGSAVVIRSEAAVRSVEPAPTRTPPAVAAGAVERAAVVNAASAVAAPAPLAAASLAQASAAAQAVARAPAKAASASAAAPTSAAAPAAATTAATAAAASKSSAAASVPAAAASAPADDDPAARWVVQVGAYNDMERMRLARQKAEKLGFKTYTTEVDTPTGKRTRVRLGPFGSKKDAEAAAVKVKANGMAANVLSL